MVDFSVSFQVNKLPGFKSLRNILKFGKSQKIKHKNIQIKDSSKTSFNEFPPPQIKQRIPGASQEYHKK